jgi:hypothetical protein
MGEWGNGRGEERRTGVDDGGDDLFPPWIHARVCRSAICSLQSAVCSRPEQGQVALHRWASPARLMTGLVSRQATEKDLVGHKCSASTEVPPYYCSDIIITI